MKESNMTVTIKQRVPALRFPEFSGEWEEKIWGEVLTGFSSGATPYRGTPEFYKGENLWVSSGELNYNYICNTKEKVTDGAIKSTNLKMHPTGTFLMAITGLEAAGTRGSCALLAVPATTNQSCMSFYDSDKVKNIFLFYFYQLYGEPFAFRYCQGTKQQSYTAEIAKILPISFPPLPEQQKIADFLSSVDGRIRLLKENKATLVEYKRGAMQQIFSKQLRFKDENGKDYSDWEEKKLGEIVVFWDGKRRPIKEADRQKMKGEYPYYGASGIIDYVNDYIFDDELILLGEDGENIISRNLPLAFQISGKCWINNHAHVLKPLKDYNIGFITLSLERVSYVKYNTGTAQPKLNQEVCQNIPFPIPSLPEQQQIADFLSAIDNKITLCSQQITQAEQYKKGLLQQMFI